MRLVLQLIILLMVANGVPILVKILLRDRFALPVDGNSKFIDGRRLLGDSKTIRGLAASFVVTTICAPAFGLSPVVGAVVAGAAMGGDLLSSFLKRRLGMASSGRATGLDQIFESLLPLLACRSLLPLTDLDVIVGTAIFCVGAVLLSRLLFGLHLRDRPY